MTPQSVIFMDPASGRGGRGAEDKGGARVPSIQELERFFKDIYLNSQMETECIIMALVYVERLTRVFAHHRLLLALAPFSTCPLSSDACGVPVCRIRRASCRSEQATGNPCCCPA